jgi:hypothetical protein
MPEAIFFATLGLNLRLEREDQLIAEIKAMMEPMENKFGIDGEKSKPCRVK